MTCPHCGTEIPVPIVAPGMRARGPYLLHVRACVRRPAADRDYYRDHHRWPDAKRGAAAC